MNCIKANCGRPAIEGGAYCEGHQPSIGRHTRAYQEPLADRGEIVKRDRPDDGKKDFDAS